MSRQKERFACWIPCKPYVKRFLLENYNVPDDKWPELINLSSNKILQNNFRYHLHRSSERFSSRYDLLIKYPELIAIEISKDDFYRYGWSLTNPEAVAFCISVERRIKQMLCTYIDIHHSFGIPISVSIRKFQNQFGFDEDCWSYDSIRREYNRNGSKETVDLNIFEKIDKIFMVKLSSFVTTSHNGK